MKNDERDERALMLKTVNDAIRGANGKHPALVGIAVTDAILALRRPRVPGRGEAMTINHEDLIAEALDLLENGSGSGWESDAEEMIRRLVDALEQKRLSQQAFDFSALEGHRDA